MTSSWEVWRFHGKKYPVELHMLGVGWLGFTNTIFALEPDVGYVKLEMDKVSRNQISVSTDNHLSKETIDKIRANVLIGSSVIFYVHSVRLVVREKV